MDDTIWIPAHAGTALPHPRATVFHGSGPSANDDHRARRSATEKDEPRAVGPGVLVNAMVAGDGFEPPTFGL